MNLFTCKSDTPKWNAQRNLESRTHYVDDSNLRFHKSRILETYVTDQGLLFSLIESVALDMHNTRRGFRHVIFDIFGTVVSRVDLEHCKSTKQAAIKAMWADLQKIAAVDHTRAAVAQQFKRAAQDMDNTMRELDAIEAPYKSKAA